MKSKPLPVVLPMNKIAFILRMLAALPICLVANALMGVAAAINFGAGCLLCVAALVGEGVDVARGAWDRTR